MVNVERTPFFRNGPAQGGGPDFSLSKGQRVTMLSYQFGYSHVATESAESGFVATEALVPAPAVASVPGSKPSRAEQLIIEQAATKLKHPAPRRPTHEEEMMVPPPPLPSAAPEQPQPAFRY